MNTTALYNEWLDKAVLDPDVTEELKSIENNTAEISDRFYKQLDFGTAGLRGIIGAGTNRVNVYTVARATQGFANFINEKYDNPCVAVAFDSRIKSELFATVAARVFAANGIKVYIYNRLMPTPLLSYAVRHLNCCGGVMVTASHNPAEYNGYKAYDASGCQLDLDDSRAVTECVNAVGIFSDVKYCDFKQGIADGVINYVPEYVVDDFLNTVKNESVRPEVCAKANLKVVYTPLHGTGNEPVRKILDIVGVKDVTVVKEQELPDGNFPTAPYPNPEIREAFNCALKLAETEKPDILLATDPDCDRVGIAVTNGNADPDCDRDGDDYKLMSGNQVGVLLLDYIINARKERGNMPENPVAVKTIVTTELVTRIAKKAGVDLRNVLTGFKFIGGIIAGLEKQGRADSYIFGFEESYGYLSGGYVRDKDAVDASMLICEMAAYYKLQNKTLLQVINEIYKEYGYYCNLQNSFVCKGASGMQRMSEIMTDLRTNPPKSLCGISAVRFYDYLNSYEKSLTDGTESKLSLPASNVLAIRFENSCTVTVRPSGTEPKIKLYIETVGASLKEAQNSANEIAAEFAKQLGF